MGQPSQKFTDQPRSTGISDHLGSTRGYPKNRGSRISIGITDHGSRITSDPPADILGWWIQDIHRDHGSRITSVDILAWFRPMDPNATARQTSLLCNDECDQWNNRKLKSNHGWTSLNNSSYNLSSRGRSKMDYSPKSNISKCWTHKNVRWSIMEHAEKGNVSTRLL